MTVSSGLVFNVLTSVSSSKYSSHSKSTTSQIHLISPQSVPRFIKYGRAAACVDRGTARYTFNLSRGSNDGKCLLQSLGKGSSQELRKFTAAATELSVCDLSTFFFCNDNKTGEAVKICPRDFWPKFNASHFLFPSARLLTAADQAAGQDLNLSVSSNSASLGMWLHL